MNFETFIEKPVSNKAVLIELGVGIGQSFFLNYEPGIWLYKLYISADTTTNYESGSFCYGAFEGEYTGLVGNGNPDVTIISFIVDGETYTETSTIANLRATNKSWLFSNGVMYVHFDNFDPPWVFATKKMGLQTVYSNRSGNYNNEYYEARVKSVSPIMASVDSLFYGLIRYGGTTIRLANEDGALDGFGNLDVFGQTVQILYGEDGAAYSDFKQVYEGIIRDFRIGFDVLSIAVEDARKTLESSVPARVFTSDILAGSSFGYIDDYTENAPVPLAYGACKRVPCFSLNDDETSPSTYTFMVCDPELRGITSIDSVFVEGSSVSPASTNTTDCTFTLNTADYDPGQTVTADIDGYAITNAIDILQDLLTNYAGFAYTSDQFDIGEWETARAVAPDIHCYIGEYQEIAAVVEKICASINGVLMEKADGKLTFRYVRESQPVQHTIRTRHCLEPPSITYPSDEYVSSINVEYDQRFAALTYKKYLDDSKQDALNALYNRKYLYSLETFLTTESAAQALATELLSLYGTIPVLVDVVVPIEFVELELLDMVALELERQNGNSFADFTAQLRMFSKNLLDGTVTLTFRYNENATNSADTVIAADALNGVGILKEPTVAT